MQIGFEPTRLKKLHSFFVAAETACSKGDLPVVAVEARLAAVIGLATAAELAAAPTELAAAVPVLPRAANGATQPVTSKRERQAKDQIKMPDLLIRGDLLFLADRFKYSSRPCAAFYGLKFAIGRPYIRYHVTFTFIAREFFVGDWAIADHGAIKFI